MATISRDAWFPTAQVVASAQEAIKDVHDGATLCIGTLGGKLQLEMFPIGATHPQSFLGSLDRVQPYKNGFAVCWHFSYSSL